jgi:capsular polysaccharide transport system permease protein
MSSAQTMNGQARLWRALDVQRRVIGALIMRELHTRFGRDNIGYAWIFGEPMLLAIAVTSMHVGSIGSSNIAMDPTPFWITGYTPFIMFRSIVSRAESVIEANGSLLYHRVVTLTDMLIARALLEAAGTSLAVFVLLSGNALLGLGTLPQRPLLMIGGLLLLAWFSFSISMLVCVGSEVSPLVGRLVHPAVYIALSNLAKLGAADEYFRTVARGAVCIVRQQFHQSALCRGMVHGHDVFRTHGGSAGSQPFAYRMKDW